jgi:hypothetical protein
LPSSSSLFFDELFILFSFQMMFPLTDNFGMELLCAFKMYSLKRFKT